MILLSSLLTRGNKGRFQSIRQYPHRRSIQYLPHLSYDLRGGVPPVLSSQSVLFHYKDIHYRGCYDLNSAIYGSGNEMKSILEIITLSRKYNDQVNVYNLATNHFNHNLMWYCIFPGGREPSTWMMTWLENYFGSLARFHEMWKASCKSIFGSGWCSLVYDQGFPVIQNTRNSDSPIANGVTPLMVIDMWEHAYFPDYGTNREAYVKNWLKAINWDYVEYTLKTLVKQKYISNHPDTTFGMPKRLVWDTPISPDNPYIEKKTE